MSASLWFLAGMITMVMWDRRCTVLWWLSWSFHKAMGHHKRARKEP